jgi:hypothetical protein
MKRINNDAVAAEALPWFHLVCDRGYGVTSVENVRRHIRVAIWAEESAREDASHPRGDLPSAEALLGVEPPDDIRAAFEEGQPVDASVRRGLTGLVLVEDLALG